MGAEIVMETARFWASRTTVDAAGAHHICEVIGPDEYHEGVDDNAYTNVLAGWNLRAAGILCDRFPDVAGRLGVAAGEVERWEEVAGGLVVPFDGETMLYEQFAGFFGLENVRAVDLAPRPFTGEMVVGVDRLRTTQVVKQSDVLMLGVMLPELVDLPVQEANYRYYEPRTSHGSSLSPAMHALVAARVGDLDDALSYFHLAGGVDLDNRMGNAADGVHIATMGGLWQAAVFGFGGRAGRRRRRSHRPPDPCRVGGPDVPHPLAGHPHRSGRARPACWSWISTGRRWWRWGTGRRCRSTAAASSPAASATVGQWVVRCDRITRPLRENETR